MDKSNKIILSIPESCKFQFRQLTPSTIDGKTFSSLESLAPIESENPIRTAGFRQAIMRIYDYTCSVCQSYVLTLDGESVTEAAHI